jgi:phosphatidylglycerophosphatase A
VPIVFLLVPIGGWPAALIGFLLHRLMDITKPPPARQLERLGDGLGVMADDVVASLYACLALAGLAWLRLASGWNLWAISSG